jgi:hypothetical protein
MTASKSWFSEALWYLECQIEAFKDVEDLKEQYEIALKRREELQEAIKEMEE